MMTDWKEIADKAKSFLRAKDIAKASKEIPCHPDDTLFVKLITEVQL